MPSEKIVRVLSLDGGGIRGLVPATILSAFEKRIGNLSKKFHLVAGTSTGGILASGIASGFDTKKMVSLYRDNGATIFPEKSLGDLATLGGAKYEAGPLEGVLAKTFGKTTLADLSMDAMLTSYDMTTREPKVFKTWKARGYDELDPSSENFRIVDACRATSAAPTYFLPAQIRNANGKQFTLIDGGVFANSPAMMAYVAARRLYPLADRYVVVSIGTGALTKPIPYDEAAGWGAVGWIKPLIDIMFSGMEGTVEYELNQLFPDVVQLRLQTSLEGVSQVMDDTSPKNIEDLQKAALRTVEANKAKIDNICKILNEPMLAREVLGYPKKNEKPRPPKIAQFDMAKITKEVRKVEASNPKAVALGGLGGAVAGGLVYGPVGAIVAGAAGAVLGTNVKIPVLKDQKGQRQV